MSIKHWMGVLLLAIGVAAVPVSAATNSPQACAASKLTPASYTWNFNAEAYTLLNHIRSNARDAHDLADSINSTDQEGQIGWQIYAAKLTSIRADVNDMSRTLCRLEVIRRSVAPPEQQAIDRAALQARLMVDSTQDAILFLNKYQNDFWLPSYRLDVKNVFEQSGRLSQAVDRFDQYAKAHAGDLHLTQVFG